MLFAQGYALFEHCAMGISDVIYLVFCWRGAMIVRRSPDSRWKAHLRWLTPMVIASGLSLYYRTFVNIHYFFGAKFGSGFDLFNRIVLLGANAIGLYGVIKLFQVLKEQVPAQSLLHKPHEQWPQAPSLQPEFATVNTAATDQNPWTEE